MKQTPDKALDSEVNPSTARTSATYTLAGALLCCSAILISALIILQIGRITPGHAAHAEMATSGSEYTMITTKGGNEEMLYVLESRTGNLLVYEPGVSGMRLLNMIAVGNFTQAGTTPPQGAGN